MVFEFLSEMLETILDPIFRPLLALPYFWAIFIMAAVITVGITLVYKYATDQERMKELKKKVKEYQEKMKAVRDQPDKMMKLQKEAMQYNMELMKHSFKPTLYTIIPIFIIFGWLNAHMAYESLSPGEEFTITAMMSEGVDSATLSLLPPENITVDNATKDVEEGIVVWTLSAEAGTYKATIDAGGSQAEKTFVITTERGEYEQPLEAYKDNAVTSVTMGNKKVKPLGESVSLFGWKPGWLGTYIILSILISVISRKLLGVV